MGVEIENGLKRILGPISNLMDTWGVTDGNVPPDHAKNIHQNEILLIYQSQHSENPRDPVESKKYRINQLLRGAPKLEPLGWDCLPYFPLVTRFTNLSFCDHSSHN